MTLSIQFFDSKKRYIDCRTLEVAWLSAKVNTMMIPAQTKLIGCNYPGNEALGELPATFYNNKLLHHQEICEHLISLVEGDKRGLEDSLCSLLDNRFTPCIHFLLWYKKDCFDSYTWPVIQDTCTNSLIAFYYGYFRNPITETDRLNLQKYGINSTETAYHNIRQILYLMNIWISENRLMDEKEASIRLKGKLYANLSILLSISKPNELEFQDIDSLRRFCQAEDLDIWDPRHFLKGIREATQDAVQPVISEFSSPANQQKFFCTIAVASVILVIGQNKMTRLLNGVKALNLDDIEY